MELRKEYEDIATSVMKENWFHYGEVKSAVDLAVERCQELADKPPVELTDDERKEAWTDALRQIRQRTYF